MNFIGTFQNKDKLPKTAKEEDAAFLKEEQALFKYKGGDWRQYFIKTHEDEEKTVTLKEFNAEIIKNIPIPKEEEVDKDKKDMAALLSPIIHEKDYFMLMCHELRYFTAFHINNLDTEKIVNEIFECLSAFGQYICYDFSNNVIEIWLKAEDDVVPVLFFNYNEGVIEI